MREVKTLIPQTGVGLKLLRGDTLQVIDPHGQQVSDLFCFGLGDHGSILSAGRSIDYADSIFLTTGNILYSNRSEPMLRIIHDSCGRHDFLLTPCSLKMFHLVNKTLDYHPSCHENLSLAFAPSRISPDSIGTTFNIFMNVNVDPKGRIEILNPISKPGDSISFVAEMDLLVGLTACSHEQTNGGVCKPIHYLVTPSQ